METAAIQKKKERKEKMGPKLRNCLIHHYTILLSVPVYAPNSTSYFLKL